MIELIDLKWTRMISTQKLIKTHEKLIANKVKKYLLTLNITANVLCNNKVII